MALDSICNDGLSGQERWFVVWSYWATKPAQVGSLLHLCASCKASTPLLQVVLAIIIPITCNSNPGYNDLKVLEA